MSNGIVGGDPPEGEVMRDFVSDSGAIVEHRGAPPFSGEELRDRGLEQAGSGLPATVQSLWHRKAMQAVETLCMAESAFTADDVRAIAGEPPTPNSIGVVMRMAFKKGLIRPCGTGPAVRPSRHASLLRYWTGA